MSSNERRVTDLAGVLGLATVEDAAFVIRFLELACDLVAVGPGVYEHNGALVARLRQ